MSDMNATLRDATNGTTKGRKRAGVVQEVPKAPPEGTTRKTPSETPKTKQGQIIALMARRQGATIAEMTSATGWQAHSIRGAISGTLRKKLGLTIVTETVAGRGRIYRIVAEA